MTTDNRPNIFPAMRYSEGGEAIEWFKAVGFDELMVVRDSGGRVVHAEMKLGPGVVHVGEKGRAEGHDAVDAAGFGISVYIQEVDAHYERTKAARVQIEEEPHDTDFGARMYSVRDPEGNLWVFGNYRPEV